MSCSTLAAVQCLDDGITRAFHRTGPVEWLTDELAQACWTANPRVAGYGLDRDVRVSQGVRTKLISSRKQRRSVLESAFRISNWTQNDMEHLLGFSPSSRHHLAGIATFPLSAITKDLVRKLAVTCERRSCVPNLWLSQCERLIERADLKSAHMSVLVETLPELLANPSVSAATAREYFEVQGSGHRRGLVEAVVSNRNLSSPEAVELLQSADPAHGDYLTIKGMRRLVRERGADGNIVDAAVIFICRSARASWPRVEMALRELVEAREFKVEHFEFIRSHLQGSSLPMGVLCAWRGVSERYIFEAMASDLSAGLFALQNPMLSEQAQFQVVHGVTRSIDACGDFLFERVARLRDRAAQFIANRIEITRNAIAGSAFIRVPQIPSGVAARLIRRNLSLIQQTDGHSPSGLTYALAESELCPEVWEALLEVAEKLSPEERSAAAAHINCPDELSERLLAISEHRGVAYAMSIHPGHEPEIREACIAALAKTGVPEDITSLLSEHSRVLELKSVPTCPASARQFAAAP